MVKYSVVVPVYNSEKSLNELYIRLKNVFDNIINEEFELILVDDFSKDNSFAIMKQLHEKDYRVSSIQLSRNCGQHPAILCGFKFAKGEYVITMDDDLQHPPEEIPKLITHIKEHPELDVVIGKYTSKKHGAIRNLGTKLSNYVSYRVYGKPKELELTSFRIIRKFVVEELLSLSIDIPRIGNMLLQVNGRIGNVIVEHDERKYGKSGYTFGRLVKDLINNLVTNSSFPLICVRDVGMGSLILSVILGLYYLLKYFIRGTSIVGWTSLVLIIIFYCGLLLFAVGIIGDYLMKILNESKKMPKYYIRKAITKDFEK